MEFRLGTLCRKLDHVHLVQLLLSGHCHISRGDTSLVPRDEILKLADLLLLSLISRFQLGLLHLIHSLEIIIISHIPIQALILHVIDDIHHVIEKWDIVGDQDKGVLILCQIALQPADMLFIQIVRRLIKEKDIRFLQEQLSEEDAGALSAA